MTQKELLYIEDAIGHEKTIISVIDSTIEQLEDEDLVTFMKGEKKNHQRIEKDLKSLLEEIKNE